MIYGDSATNRIGQGKRRPSSRIKPILRRADPQPSARHAVPYSIRGPSKAPVITHWSSASAVIATYPEEAGRQPPASSRMA